VFESRLNYSRAQQLLEAALEIWRAQGNASHPDSGTAWFNLGRMHEYQSNLREADKSYTQALAIYGRAYGRDSAELTACLGSLIRIRQLSGCSDAVGEL
jgi:tetratricopeptide (TPR) repeat protein